MFSWNALLELLMAVVIGLPVIFITKALRKRRRARPAVPATTASGTPPDASPPPPFPFLTESLSSPIFWVMVIVAVTGIWLGKFAPESVSSKVLDHEWNWSWLAVFASLGYLILSYRLVELDEKALFVALGTPGKETLKSGTHFVPFIISKLRKIKGATQQMELPGEPEQIWTKRTDDGKQEEPLPTGDDPEAKSPSGKPWVRAIRVTFNDNEPTTRSEIPVITTAENERKSKEKTKTDKNDPLKKRVTVEVSFVARFKITDPVMYLTNIGDDGEGSELIKQLSDAVVTRTSALLQMGTLARALSYTQEISVEAAKQVNVQMNAKDDFGFEVGSIQIKFRLARDLSLALQEAANATAKKLALIEEGLGHAAATKSLRDAGVDPNLQTAVTMVSDALQKSKYTYFAGSGGFIDAMQLAAGLKEVIGQTVGKDQPKPTPPVKRKRR